MLQFAYSSPTKTGPKYTSSSSYYFCRSKVLIAWLSVQVASAQVPYGYVRVQYVVVVEVVVVVVVFTSEVFVVAVVVNSEVFVAIIVDIVIDATAIARRMRGTWSAAGSRRSHRQH